MESNPDRFLVKTHLPVPVIPAVYDKVVLVVGVDEAVEVEAEAEMTMMTMVTPP